MIVPIKREHIVLGIVVLKRPGSFTAEQQDLVERVVARAAVAIENARLYAAVRAADRAKSEFVGVVAHDLKVPMTSILGYSDLLARGSGLREEQVNRYLQRIDANLMRMRVMLDNLLTVLAQPEHPDRSARGVDVSRVIRDAVDRTLPQFNEKGLAVHVAIDDLLPPMFAHPDSVTRIIDNLLVNATQRSPQGGDVRVSAALKSAPGDEDTVMISVTDHGRRLPALPGADAADAADVDASTRVALRIVKFLAEHHGGSAWAESLPAGTGFHVTLPFRRTA
ncbi:hypothetical protein DCC79_12655 [bacterium]|nr:MAG: hypothetical protein DCC79_12655 [bacterium]